MGSVRLNIGTSGWSYRHWSGIFYPKEIKPDKYLEYYTNRFNCVELNSSFYHLPQSKTISGWMKRTPVTFRFCPKMNRFITHQKKLADTEEALERYFNVFEEMKDKMGPVLIQLPPRLSFERSLTSNFLDILKTCYGHFRFALEARHKSWIKDEVFDLLSGYRTAFVIADSGNRFPYFETVTADFVYLRFHGREQLYASDYSEYDLRMYAEKISGWINDDKEVWVFFNNDYHGFAVKNAEKLREMIRQILK